MGTHRRTVKYPIFELGDRYYEVNASVNKPLNYMHVRKIVERMERASNNHSKLCVLVFVLHRSSYTPDNQIWSLTIKALEKELIQKYGNQILVDYICARECDKSEAQHYHLALILDGKRVNRKFVALELLSKVWKKNGGAKVTHLKTHNISRKDTQSLNLAIYHLSYFAKLRSKEKLGQSTRNFFVRRL
jgi:hypothetical protein